MAAMVSLAVLVLLVVELGGGFGAASAEATASDDVMEVTISVTAPSSAGAVIAHFMLPGEDEVTHSMSQAGVRWTGLLELRPGDWTVVFEAVGTGDLSQPRTLTALGVDRSVLVSAPPPAEVEEPGVVVPWRWLALACAAAAAAIIVALVGSGRSAGRRHLA